MTFLRLHHHLDAEPDLEVRSSSVQLLYGLCISTKTGPAPQSWGSNSSKVIVHFHCIDLSPKPKSDYGITAQLPNNS